MNSNELIFVVASYASHLASKCAFLWDDDLSIREKTQKAAKVIRRWDDKLLFEVFAHVYLWTGTEYYSDWELREYGIYSKDLYEDIEDFMNSFWFEPGVSTRKESDKLLYGIISNHDDGNYNDLIRKIRPFMGHDQDYVIIAASLKYLNVVAKRADFEDLNDAAKYIDQQFDFSNPDNSVLLSLLQNTDVLTHAADVDQDKTLSLIEKLMVLMENMGLNLEYLEEIIPIPDEARREVKRSIETRDIKWLHGQELSDEEFQELLSSLEYDEDLDRQVLSKKITIHPELSNDTNILIADVLRVMKSEPEWRVQHDRILELIDEDPSLINKLSIIVSDVADEINKNDYKTAAVLFINCITNKELMKVMHLYDDDALRLSVRLVNQGINIEIITTEPPEKINKLFDVIAVVSANKYKRRDSIVLLEYLNRLIKMDIFYDDGWLSLSKDSTLIIILLLDDGIQSYTKDGRWAFLTKPKLFNDVSKLIIDTFGSKGGKKTTKKPVKIFKNILDYDSILVMGDMIEDNDESPLNLLLHLIQRSLSNPAFVEIFKSNIRMAQTHFQYGDIIKVLANQMHMDDVARMVGIVSLYSERAVSSFADVLIKHPNKIMQVLNDQIEKYNFEDAVRFIMDVTLHPDAITKIK